MSPIILQYFTKNAKTPPCHKANLFLRGSKANISREWNGAFTINNLSYVLLDFMCKSCDIFAIDPIESFAAMKCLCNINCGEAEGFLQIAFSKYYACFTKVMVMAVLWANDIASLKSSLSKWLWCSILVKPLHKGSILDRTTTFLLMMSETCLVTLNLKKIPLKKKIGPPKNDKKYSF